MTETEQEDHWKAYYKKIEKRQPRELFQKWMALMAGEGGAAAPGFAIDLGCGDGTETLALLSHGWSVLAIDYSPDAIQRVIEGARFAGHGRLQTQQARFEQATLPPADLVYAGLSLPFCPPAHLPQLWRKIGQALRPGGWFAGHFFGVRDSWASNPEMTFLTASQLETMLEGYDLALYREAEEDRPSVFEEMKHFHYFEVIARKPA